MPKLLLAIDDRPPLVRLVEQGSFIWASVSATVMSLNGISWLTHSL